MDGLIEKRKVRCSGCRQECGLVLELKQGLVVDVLGDPEDPMSHGRKCNRPNRVIGYREEQAQMLLRQRPRGPIPICPG